MAKTDFSEQELSAAAGILADLTRGRTAQAVERLRALKDQVYAAIPDKQRQSRGITWTLMRISDLIVKVNESESAPGDERLKQMGMDIFGYLALDDRLIGVAIYLMAAYGRMHPEQVFDFFEEASASSQWEVREFAASGFHKLIKPHREIVHPWLKMMAQHPDLNRRRFASETLRPVTDNRWINDEPDYSLAVLRLMFREAHPYPRTSVGNNLSDLARRNPELIYKIVQELVESGDKNSHWIAYRACRNLVKKDPQRVMDLLGVDAYIYKDRRFFREG